MVKKELVLLIIAFILIVIFVGCGPKETPAPTATPTEKVHEGKALVASRCIGCHDISRVTNAAYDREGWEKTVERMVLSGAKLNDEQKALVIDYLTITYPKE